MIDTAQAGPIFVGCTVLLVRKPEVPAQSGDWIGASAPVPFWSI